MAGYVFFDLETTGLNKAFDQILQFAAIHTDNHLKELDRYTIRCRLMPHVVPSPTAMVLTGLSPSQLTDRTLPSHYEMIQSVKQKLLDWSPATFLGWNSIRFDEDLLRRAFYTTLNHPYLTMRGGNNRTDALTIARAVHHTVPGALQFSLKHDGQPDFRLESLAAANGFMEHKTHEAEGDVEATLFICQLIKDRAPHVWSAASRFARKDEAVEFLDQNAAVALVSHWDRGYPTPIVSRIGQHSERKNEQYLFNLSYDPEVFISATDFELLEILTQAEPQLIIQAGLNAAPIFDYPEDVPHSHGDIDILESRAEFLRDNPRLMERLSKAKESIAWKPEKSEHVELQIYDGFTQDPDWIIAEEFHNIAWHKRMETAAEFQDDRLRRIARRLLFLEAPEFMETRKRDQVIAQLRKRFCEAPDERHWRTIPAALTEAQELAASDDVDKEHLSDIVAFLNQREQDLQAQDY